MSGSSGGAGGVDAGASVYLHGSALLLLDTNKVNVEVLVEVHHSVDHHLGEEGVVAADELRVQGSTSAPLKHGAHLAVDFTSRGNHNINRENGLVGK